MKATRNEFLKIYNILAEIKGKQDKTFSMYVNLNLKQLQPLIENIKVIADSAKPSDKYKEFSLKEISLLREYCEKTEDGNPVQLGPNQFRIKSEYVDVYNMAKDQLLEEYKDVVDEQKKLIEESENLMKEEVENEITEIPFSAFPEEFDVEQQRDLMGMIKDFEV